jgi:hypothetical protein
MTMAKDEAQEASNELKRVEEEGDYVRLGE